MTDERIAAAEVWLESGRFRSDLTPSTQMKMAELVMADLLACIREHQADAEALKRLEEWRGNDPKKSWSIAGPGKRTIGRSMVTLYKWAGRHVPDVSKAADTLTAAVDAALGQVQAK